MNGFREWLQQVERQASGEVAAGEVPPLGAGDLEGLRTGLRARMARNETYFRIAFGLAVLLAIAALVTAFLPVSKGAAWVPAALGVSAAGAVAMAMNAVREKASFDVMLELAVGLDEDAVRQVLRVLIEKYAASGTGRAPGSVRAVTRRTGQGR